tara:strand:- start:30 stop:284 length:255 start_codon:yes stop_codon:yes gene_type:complete
MVLPHHIVLSPGDVVIDTMTSESGVLVVRFDVMASFEDLNRYPIWAWDILWAGSEVTARNARRSAYTEEGLQHLIFEGVFVHLK